MIVSGILLRKTPGTIFNVRWHPGQIRGDGEDLHLLHIFVDADACPVTFSSTARRRDSINPS